MSNEQLIKETVKAILVRPHGFKWSVQGLGMLRTYLSDEVRLHVWDSAVRIPNVSPMHDHPWHLDSYIVAGEVRQFRYTIENPPTDERFHRGLIRFNYATIKCGENACTVTEPQPVYLRQGLLEQYKEGQNYRQDKYEIHESLPLDGTVTLVKRTFTPDRDHARVFWEGDGGFVSAEPRAATHEEIELITMRSLEKWF